MKGTVFIGIAVVLLLIGMGFWFVVSNEKIEPEFENMSKTMLDNFNKTGTNASERAEMEQDQSDFLLAYKTVPFIFIFGAILIILISSLVNKSNVGPTE